MLGIIFLLCLSVYVSAEDVAATLGGNVRLTCNVGGTIFTWSRLYYNDQRVALSNDMKYEGRTTAYLTITKFETADVGVYQCTAYRNRKFQGHGSIITVTLSGRVDGNWGTWGMWSGCSETCGNGYHFRTRMCNNPPPSDGGLQCSGDTQQSNSCLIRICPVHGKWGQWSPWNGCSVTCGNGQRIRTRKCNNPPASGGGNPCSGDMQQTNDCHTSVCPEWTNWLSWNPCSVNCGYGTRLRHRLCKQCSTCVALDSKQCTGVSYEAEKCSSIPCSGRLNGSLTLGCDLGTTDHTFNWRKNGNQYFISYPYSKYIGTNSLKLTILTLQYNDDGQYRCESSTYPNNVGKYIQISVFGKPQVSVSHPSYAVQIGATVTFICNIQSNPGISELWWTDNQVQVITDTRRYSDGNILNPNLSIISVKDSDSGVYTCNAKNAHGTAKAWTTLITGNIPQATILKDYYVAIEGHDITLECLIKTDPNNQDLYWLKGTTNQRLYRADKYSVSTLSIPSLTVKKIGKNDAGNYTCKLVNTIGNSEDIVELKVLSVYVEDQINLNIRANDTITLLCVVTGGNRVAWRRNNQIIDTTSSIEYSGGTVKTPPLTISKLTRYHSGNYTCETSYDLVKVTSKNAIQLYVKDTPLVHRSSDNIQASTGTPIQLKCVYESYPAPTAVFWKRDGEYLNVSDSKYNGSSIKDTSLTILNTEQRDSGIYVCGVVNEIGTGYSKNIQLIIKDPEKTSSALTSAVGGVIGAIVVFVAVFICFMVLRRRRNSHEKNSNRQKVDTRHTTFKQAVQFRPETKSQGETYMNIGLVSSTDTDEDEATSTKRMQLTQQKATKAISSKKNTSNFGNDDEFTNQNDKKQTIPLDRNLDNATDDSTYYNIDDIITSIRVSELKDYIFKRKSNVNGKLEDEYKKIPYGVQHPTTKAQLKENVPKNRFKTTFPYDHTRVVLEPCHGMSSDYINANYVDGFEKEKCYIASQGPVKHTINDQWRMIWQNNTRKIIMLTNLVEGPKRKCEQYWPEGGKPMTCDNLILTLLTEKERAAYITREIQVVDKKTKEKRCIIQYHFTAWPDHGTPDPLYLVLFHKHVISDHTSTENNGPLLVHCSAGIGRTGTYIGLDALHEEGLATGFVDVVKFVKKMRYSRMNMVQTPEQYVCLHYALLEAFTMKDTNVGKEEFGTIWQKIVSDKGPANRQRLREEFKMLEAKKTEHDKAQFVAAKSPENVKKNRNKSIIPTDNNRLFLTSYEKGRTDYINAVQAPSYTKFIGYLTTQLPLPDTKVDFWTMVRDHNSSTIVVFLNDPSEADLVYSTSKDSFTCGKYNLTISNRGKEDMDITSCKVVLSKKDDKQRDIAMYLAVSKGLPDPQVLCKLVTLISTRVSMSNDPVTVVSGDGAKNCGVFCTFANAVSSMAIDNNANIFQLARLLQLRRPEFFADYNEYRLCYEALNLYLESSSVYANF